MAKLKPCKTCPFLKGTENIGAPDWLKDMGRRLRQRLISTLSSAVPNGAEKKGSPPTCATRGKIEMITVAVLINGQPIVAKNAINQAEENEDGYTKYLTDGGDVVWHKRGDGAVTLAKKLLDCIRNEGV